MLVFSSLAMTLLFAALAAPARPSLTLFAVGLLFLAQSGAQPLIDVLVFAIFTPGGAPAWGGRSASSSRRSSSLCSGDGSPDPTRRRG